MDTRDSRYFKDELKESKGPGPGKDWGFYDKCVVN